METSIICRLERDIWFSGIARGVIKMFMLRKVGEQVLESPAFVSKFHPVIVVKFVTSHIHLVINGAGSTEAFSSRLIHDKIADRFL